jgi:hypothetical protein
MALSGKRRTLVCKRIIRRDDHHETVCVRFGTFELDQELESVHDRLRRPFCDGARRNGHRCSANMTRIVTNTVGEADISPNDIAYGE